MVLNKDAVLFDTFRQKVYEILKEHPEGMGVGDVYNILDPKKKDRTIYRRKILYHVRMLIKHKRVRLVREEASKSRMNKNIYGVIL